MINYCFFKTSSNKYIKKENDDYYLIINGFAFDLLKNDNINYLI